MSDLLHIHFHLFVVEEWTGLYLFVCVIMFLPVLKFLKSHVFII